MFSETAYFWTALYRDSVTANTGHWRMPNGENLSNILSSIIFMYNSHFGFMTS